MSRYQFIPDRPLDQTPLEMPLGANRPKTLQDMMAEMIQVAITQEKGEDVESFEEADDFEPDQEEDYLLEMSPYTFTDLNDDEETPPQTVPEAPQEENSAPDKEEPEAMKAEPLGDSAGLEPQNDLPDQE